MARFPYVEPNLYQETKSVEQRLKDSRRTLLRKELGARFSKAPETFRAPKAIFSSSVSENGEVYTP